MSEGTTDLAAFGLGEPKIRVTLVAEGAAKPFEFELGDSVPAGSGVFARVPGSPRLFTVSSTWSGPTHSPWSGGSRKKALPPFDHP